MTSLGFRRLPLFWKILVPFMALLVLVGVVGAFLIVRNLSSRARDELDRDLSRRSLEVRSTLRDAEVSLLESATLAANLEGMSSAVHARDIDAIARLARSVLALKAELEFVALLDTAGIGLVEIRRSGGDVQHKAADAWQRDPVASRALAERTSGKHAGIAGSSLVIAAPICTAAATCAATGVAVVGVPLAAVAAAANGAATAGASVSLYDERGRLLASAGPIRAPRAISPPSGDEVVRRLSTSDAVDVATLIGPHEIQGRNAGRIAISIASAPAFASAREAAVRLALLLGAAMAGVTVVGALISRHILTQVRRLVEVNRSLGAGDLAARVPVLTDDELGELARGVNAMATQLQQTYETLESRVAERTAEVMRLLQERTDFFAAISHELRTPLAVIIAQAELMRDPTVHKTSSWTAETGTAIGDSASQLLSLVNDILDLARAEAGRLVVTRVPIDLAQLITSMRPAVDGLARAGQIEAHFNVPKELRVEADPRRLSEVLLNLIDNAVKYTPPGGRIDVRVAARPGGVVHIEVSDTGIGIPPDVGDRIFEPFFRVSGSEPQFGQASSGLGLALARRLVEAHGGSISYASTSRGTRFVVALPASAIAPMNRTRATRR